MQITLKLFASLTDFLPVALRASNQMVLDIAPTTTVMQVLTQQQLPLHLVHLVLVNGHYIQPADRTARTLNDGDVLAVWPPIAGG